MMFLHGYHGYIELYRIGMNVILYHVIILMHFYQSLSVLGYYDFILCLDCYNGNIFVLKIVSFVSLQLRDGNMSIIVK